MVKSAPIYRIIEESTFERPYMYIFSFENFLNVVRPNELKFSLIDFYIRFCLFIEILEFILFVRRVYQ